MPGPSPKDPSVRARRNAAATKSTLKADASIVAPELPAGDWHEQVLTWWRDVWASPMAPEFDESDRHGLFALAILKNDFWFAESAKERKEIAAELRLQEQRFGLSPIDRRRLQWEIERAEDAQDKRQQRSSRSSGAKKSSRDPRGILHAI